MFEQPSETSKKREPSCRWTSWSAEREFFEDLALPVPLTSLRWKGGSPVKLAGRGGRGTHTQSWDSEENVWAVSVWMNPKTSGYLCNPGSHSSMSEMSQHGMHLVAYSLKALFHYNNPDWLMIETTTLDSHPTLWSLHYYVAIFYFIFKDRQFFSLHPSKKGISLMLPWELGLRELPKVPIPSVCFDVLQLDI